MTPPERTVLLVTNAVGRADFYGAMLRHQAAVNYRIVAAPDDDQLMGQCSSLRPDGVLIESCDSSTAALDLLKRLKTRWEDASPPIIILGSDDLKAAVTALKAGAADYLVRDRLTAAELCLALQTAIREAFENRLGTSIRPGIAQAASNLQRQCSQTQKQLEERLELVIQAVNGLVFDISQVNLEADDRVYRSEQLFDLIGVYHDDAPPTSRWWQARIHPDDQAQYHQCMAELFASACEHYETEYRVRHQQGHWVDVWERLRLVRDRQGQVVRVVGSTVDISKHKAALRDRHQAELDLRESEDRLRMALESARIGTWDWNLITNSLTWDAACKAMFGLPTEAESSIERFYESLHPDDRDRLRQVMEQAMTASSGGSYDAEYRIIGLEDGMERWLRTKGQVYFDRQGTPLRFIGTALDITQRKQAEAERERLLGQEQAARTEAERANRIKDEFLAILSHELRSPLNPILGWAKLLQTKKLDSDKTARALATIERNAKLQAQLIDDLLDIAKILRGKLKIEAAPVDPVFIVESAIETVQAAADAKAIQIQTDLPDLGLIQGDGARIQQIVWNLLTNAVKFTPEQGQITVQLAQVDHWVQLKVADTGRGIRPEFLPHIFDSFCQEDTSVTRQFGGLGLGLAIVRYLVEAHGGTIAADSRGEGCGATFTVRLPLHSNRPSYRSPAALLGEIDLTGVRVLAIDDNADALTLLTILLGQYGAEVQGLDSAAEALTALATFQPHVLVSDIGMPNLDGYALIQQIRTLPAELGGQVPAIALTAYVRDEDQHKALDSGFQRHLPKPVEPDTIALAVAELRSQSLRLP